jgi:NAD(P)-dependent dehydrogenase (short-subunit alcohol dehydrogenase family)
VGGELLEPARADPGARSADARARIRKRRQRQLARSLAPFPAFGQYAAAKAALSAATNTLQLELRGSGVQAIEVLLGTIDTAGSRVQTALPGGERWLKSAPNGRADVAARRILRAIERDRGRVIYPALLRSAYLLPSIPRAFSRYYARFGDPSDEMLRDTSEAPETRAIRAEWENERYG